MPAIIAKICHGVTEITRRVFSVLAVTSWREIFSRAWPAPTARFEVLKNNRGIHESRI